MNNKFISIGKITNFHGIQGAAKVGYSKTQAEFIAKLKVAFIQKEAQYIEFKISSVKLAPKFAIIKFEAFNSIEDVLEYKNCLIYVPKTELQQNLDTDEFLISDLISMEVFVNEKKVGVITGISNNGATDLLAVKSIKTNKISLVPFVKELVPEVNLENKKVFINNIEGLIE